MLVTGDDPDRRGRIAADRRSFAQPAVNPIRTVNVVRMPQPATEVDVPGQPGCAREAEESLPEQRVLDEANEALTKRFPGRARRVREHRQQMLGPNRRAAA